MQKSLPIRSRLVEVAASLSREARQSLSRAKQETENRIKSQLSGKERYERERAKREALEARLLIARMPLAHKGLAQILAIGRSKPMQDILEARKTLGVSGIAFYRVSRPSGDAWDINEGSGTRDVLVSFEREHLEVVYGFFGVEGTLWKILYTPRSEAKVATRTQGSREEEPAISIGEFLGLIADPYDRDLSVVEDWDQRDYEWDPEDVVFQLLVSCARKPILDQYLTRCLKALQTPA